MHTLDPNFRPSKKLGQNFLTSEALVERIAQAGLESIGISERIIEIGPGKGVLTRALLKHTQIPITAIEKDKRLYEYVQGFFAHEIETKRLTLINDDALEFEPPVTPYSVIANIPYNITSPLIDHFIRDAALDYTPARMPIRAVLLVQKEVAEKMCAKAPDMNVLALHVQTFAQAKYLFTVTAGNFSPKPKVDSAVVELVADVEACKNFSKEFLKNYFDLIHRAFSQKRKMLSSTIGKELCAKAGIDATRRPQTLSVEEWIKLAAY